MNAPLSSFFPDGNRRAQNTILDSIRRHPNGALHFEYVCGFLLELHYGHAQIRLTPRTNDGGIDLIFTPKRTKDQVGVAQCKRHLNQKIGPDMVGAFYFAANHYREKQQCHVSSLFFFSFTEFTDSAQALARSHGITPCGGPELQSLITMYAEKLVCQFVAHCLPLFNNSGMYALTPFVEERASSLPLTSRDTILRSLLQHRPATVALSAAPTTFATPTASHAVPKAEADTSVALDAAAASPAAVATTTVATTNGKRRKIVPPLENCVPTDHGKPWSAQDDNVIQTWHHVWKTDKNNAVIAQWKAVTTQYQHSFLNFIFQKFFITKRSYGSLHSHFFELKPR